MSQGDTGYQHEKAVVMAMIAKYKVDPSSYLGQGKESEYLRTVFRMPSFESLDRNLISQKRNELSDRLGNGTYQLMKSPFSSLYSNSGLYNEIGRDN